MTPVTSPVNAPGEGHQGSRQMPRYPQLDGWRAISILCVMAAHMLPLGPKRFRLNEMAAEVGMCLFFTLSGYLITMTLIYRPSVSEFLMRRLCRILPLAWLFLLIVLPVLHVPAPAYPAHFLFYLNLPLRWLTPWTGHFWSLCVEVQFYLGVAILFGIAGRKGLRLLPLLAIAVTIFRAWNGVTSSIVTYYRIDEIFAGATLALISAGLMAPRLGRLLDRIHPGLALALLLVCCHTATGPANYFRPYMASLLVGSTLWQSGRRSVRFLHSRRLAHIAAISYALYVLHPLTTHGAWFDPADKVLKYLRRPLGIALSFTGAHLSTRYYESRWIALGKRWSARSKAQPASAMAQGN